MGYTTDFVGAISITPTLSKNQIKYIQAFNESRRMKRDSKIVGTMNDPIREAALLPTCGVEGEYFVSGHGTFGQAKDASVVNANQPPGSQPGLWCQWTVDDEGKVLIWDEGEKFYCYTEWLEYLIEHFFKPWGKELNGSISWLGEEIDDRGTIYVKNNEVEEINDEITNPGPSWDKHE